MREVRPSLAVDITEFIRNPIRTGIQRVVRELLIHWPPEIPKAVVRFDPAAGGFIPVGQEILEYCIAQISNPHLSIAETAGAIAAAVSDTDAATLDLVSGDRVLIPELFAALDRLQYYEHLRADGVELFPIVYDLLAWTAPDALNISYVGGLNDYLAFVFRAKQRSFISRNVHDVYHSRFLRRPSGGDAVMPLGSDSLRKMPAKPLRESPYLICAGALDGRKGQDLVHQAFMLCDACKSLNLVFAGKVPSNPRREMLPILTSEDQRVVVVDDPTDGELAALIQGAEASVFISRNEGFGLPAVESLYLGTPVVVATDLPAISNYDSSGQIRLKTYSNAELVAALERLAQPEEVLQLRSEISRLDLQTWTSYAKSIAIWASS